MAKYEKISPKLSINIKEFRPNLVIVTALRWLLYNSFMIAHALRTKAQVICVRSKERISVFRDFITSAWAQKAKLTVNSIVFPLVKFCETWQTGSKRFTLVGACFSRKSIRPVFFRSGERHKFAKSRKTCFVNKPFFFVFKIRIPQDAICCGHFERFHQRKFKIITNKAIKR